MDKFAIRVIILFVLVTLVSVFLTGCGTTSVMECDRFIGPEKEECTNQMRLKQHQMLPVWERVGARDK